MGPWYFVEEQMQPLLVNPIPGTGLRRQLGYVGPVVGGKPGSGRA